MITTQPLVTDEPTTQEIDSFVSSLEEHEQAYQSLLAIPTQTREELGERLSTLYGEFSYQEIAIESSKIVQRINELALAKKLAEEERLGLAEYF